MPSINLTDRNVYSRKYIELLYFLE